MTSIFISYSRKDRAITTDLRIRDADVFIDDQKLTAGDYPHLLRIDFKAGYILSKPPYKLIEGLTLGWK